LTCLKPLPSGREYCRRRLWKGISMLDVIMLAIGIGFFALSVAYVFACDRL
jgi:hypothetical protein